MYDWVFDWVFDCGYHDPEDPDLHRKVYCGECGSHIGWRCDETKVLVYRRDSEQGHAHYPRDSIIQEVS